MKKVFAILLLFLASCSQSVDYQAISPVDTHKILIWNDSQCSSVGDKTGKLYTQRQWKYSSEYLHYAVISKTKNKIYRIKNVNNDYAVLYIDNIDDLLDESIEFHEFTNTKKVELDLFNIEIETVFLDKNDELIIAYRNDQYNYYVVKVNENGLITVLIDSKARDYPANIYYYNKITNIFYGYYMEEFSNYPDIYLTREIDLNTGEYFSHFSLFSGYINGDFSGQLSNEKGIDNSLYILTNDYGIKRLYRLRLDDKSTTLLFEYDNQIVPDAFFIQNSTDIVYSFDETHLLKMNNFMSGDKWTVPIRKENDEFESVHGNKMFVIEINK